MNSRTKVTHRQVNTTTMTEAVPAGTVAGYHSPATIDLSTVKETQITKEECERRRANRLCMYYKYSRHFVASCSIMLMVVSGPKEINPFKEDMKKANDKESETKLGKV